ncbi:ester cyclase [Pimelobacter simplex]|uniref:ester cyclase n=1 Tax=Nocardioides simplex TaxID=2045 RepID=UPI003810F58D
MNQNPAQAAALRVFAAINTGDLDCLDELVTDDFVDHGSPFPLPPGPAGYRQVLTFVTQVLRIRYDLEDVFATDDRVVVRALAHGVGVDAVHGPGADGGRFTMATAHIYRTEGDRLAEHWGIRDEYGARVQLGTVAAPGS